MAEKISTDNKSSLFDQICLFFVKSGLTKDRIAIFKTQISKYRGVTLDKFDGSRVTHIITSDVTSLESIEREIGLKYDSINCPILDANWISESLKLGKQAPLTSYNRSFKKKSKIKAELPLPENDSIVAPPTPPPELYHCKEVATSETENGKPNLRSHSSVPTTSQTDVTKNSTQIASNTTGRWKNFKRKNSDRNSSKIENILNKLGSDSDYHTSDDENENFEISQKTFPDPAPENDSDDANQDRPVKKLKGFACMSPVIASSNLNKHITDKLEQLAVIYKVKGERWRERSYSKAIAVIKKHPKEITSWEEAKNLPCVGKNLADKISEIISSGKLQKLDYLSQDTNVSVVSLFLKVWGAGPVTANNWVAQGFKTLQDVKEKGEPTKQQLIGLQYYDEFCQRIPRPEALEIENMVKEIVATINPGLEVTTCGSFRRGRETCGDVDCLVTHPDGISHKGVFHQILQKGHERGFLTEDLSIHSSIKTDDQDKYLGVCLLPGENRLHRRLDIIVVPYSHWACALVYFTGSAHFNRSMRLYAQKNGMHLSEKHLYTDVIRKGSDILHEGTILPTFSERDVFKFLKLDYLEPHERDK